MFIISSTLFFLPLSGQRDKRAGGVMSLLRYERSSRPSLSFLFHLICALEPLVDRPAGMYTSSGSEIWVGSFLGTVWSGWG